MDDRSAGLSYSLTLLLVIVIRYAGRFRQSRILGEYSCVLEFYSLLCAVTFILTES